MFDGNSADNTNPFAMAADASPSRHRGKLLSALKFLVIIAAGLAVTLAVGNQSRRWLLKRLTSDFQTLAPLEKQSRLTQLSELGMPGIEPMVASLCDANHDVARTAYDLLRTRQNEWEAIDRDDALAHHTTLVDAMQLIAAQIADDRTTWTTSLLQQSIAISVRHKDEASTSLYTAATAMLDRMSLSDRAGPSILVESSTDAPEPRRLTVRSQPLPVAPSDTIENWTDWPPPSESDRPAATTSPGGDEAPRVYRSSAGVLRPVAPEDTVTLLEVEQPTSEPPATASAAETRVGKDNERHEETDIRPASHLIDSPLEMYDTKSVIFWLGNSHQPLRAAAKSELLRRGLSEREIAIATRIAAGDLQTKLDLIDHIARERSMDPRPWLLLLLDDPSRDVKLKTVSVLATIKDHTVEQHLREHIIDEPDPTVAFRIRRLLDLR